MFTSKISIWVLIIRTINVVSFDIVKPKQLATELQEQLTISYSSFGQVKSIKKGKYFR